MADGLSVQLLAGTKLGNVGQVITLSASTAIEEVAAGRATFVSGANSSISINDPILIAAGASGAIQSVRQACTLTANDIQLGYKEVFVPWPTPWPDLNETTAFAICNPNQTDGIDFAPGTTYGRQLNGIWVILNLTAANPIVQGQFDNYNTSSPLTYSFTPLTEGLYEITQYLHPKGTAVNYADGILTTVTYTGEGADGPITLQASPMVTTGNGSVADDSSPIYSNTGGSPAATISVSTKFTTYSVIGIASGSFYGPNAGVTVVQTGTGSTGLELNNPALTTISACQITSATSATLTVADSTGGSAFIVGAPVVIAGLVGTGAASVNGTTSTVVAAPALVAGSVAVGTFIVGEMVVQASTGSNGVFYEVTGGNLYLNDYMANSPNSHSGWVGQTSGAVFLPSGSPVAGTVIIVAGSGWTAHANVTGLSGTINSYLYIGKPSLTPNASGVWTDTVNGGTYTPSTAPTVDTFPYHFSVRVVQMPNNQTIYTPGQTTYLNVISIHD